VSAEGYGRRTDRKIYQGCKFDAKAPYGKLLGRVGDGPVIRVGLGGVFRSQSSGDLQFRINDQDQCLVDNSDGINVWVVPGATRARPGQVRGLVNRCQVTEATRDACIKYAIEVIATRGILVLIQSPYFLTCMASKDPESDACQRLQGVTGIPVTF